MSADLGADVGDRVTNPWWPLFEGDPWGTPCTCGHPMREHILDWDVDPEVDCRRIGCTCPEFVAQTKAAS